MKIKTSIVLLLALFFTFQISLAQDGYKISVLSSTADEIVLDVKIASHIQKQVVLEPLVATAYGADATGPAYQVEIKGATPILSKGKPDISKLAATLQLDLTGHYEAEVVDGKYEEVQNILIAPSKGNLSRKVDPRSQPYAFGEVYTQDAFYPGNLVETHDPFILRNTRGMHLWVYPIQYQPVTRTLRVYSSMRIRLQKVAARGEQELEQAEMTKVESATFSGICRRLYLNAPAETNSAAERGASGNVPERMLVLCPDALLPEIEPLVAWKRQMGIHTTLVPTSALPGTDTSSVINFVKQAYLTDGISYLLVVGDESFFAPPMRIDGTPFSCDNCLGYITGDDNLPEVMVGRFHAQTAEELRIMVARNLEYEKSPVFDPASPWMSRMLWAASNEGEGIGDDGQADYAHANEWKTAHLAHGAGDCYEFYDSDHSAISPTPGHYTADQPSSPQNTEIVAVLNGPGAGLYNYTGHGWIEGLASGNFNTGAVGDLTNTGQYPILIGVACCAGDFTDPNTDCLGEVLQRAGNPVSGQAYGSIAAFLSSDFQSWAPPMEGQDGMNQYLMDADGLTLHPTIGGMSAYGNARMIQAYDQAGELMAGFWNPFHEPTFVPRTRLPQEIAGVSVPTQLFLGESSLTVQCPVEGALVGVYFKGQTIGAARIAGGTATVTFAPLNDVGEMIVTFSQFNYIPEQVTLNVSPQTGPFVVQHAIEFIEQTGNGDAQIDYSEQYLIGQTLRNVGLNVSGNITATISTTNPFLTITDATESYAPILAGGDLMSNNAFSFIVHDSIPDESTVVFQLALDFGGTSPYLTTFSAKLHAPRLLVTEITIDDSFSGNNNRRLDSGESAVIRITNRNEGSSTSPYGWGHLTSNSPFVTVVPMSAVGEIVSGATKPAQFNVSVAPDAPMSHQVIFDYQIEADKYSAQRSFDPQMVNAIIATFNGVGFSGFPFTQADDKPWLVTQIQPYEGTHCVRSGVIADNKKSTLVLTINVLEAGDVRFARRVSSEADYDYLRFSIDDVEQNAWSGTQPWAEFKYPLSAGSHILKWSYTKDELISEGADLASVDAIQLPNIEQLVAVFDAEVGNIEASVLPNPTSGLASLRYTLKQADQISIDVFDAFGKYLFNTLPLSRVSEGQWSKEVDLTGLPSGIYFIKIQGGETLLMQRVVKD